MERILLIGAGALARDMVECFGRDRFIAVFVDPEHAAHATLAGLDVLSDWSAARARASHYLVAIGDMAGRRQTLAAARGAGLQPASPLVSTDARLAADCRIGRGSAIGHFSMVGPAATIDEDCVVMHGCTVGHDSVVGQNVVMCPGTRIGGYTRVGADVFFGPNAVLSPRVAVGAGCHVAAGAAVFRDVPAARLVIGNPARERSLADAGAR